MSRIEASATFVEAGMDYGDGYGDHGEFHQAAVHVTRETTVGELIDMYLTDHRTVWSDNGETRVRETVARKQAEIVLRPIHTTKESI